MSNIGNNIIKLRKEMGISQIGLAKIIGVSKQNMFKYEHGIIEDIPYSKVEKLAQALHTDLNTLAGWNEEINNISDEEKFLLEQYRKLSDRQKTKITLLINEAGDR